jgi:DNA-directed RNA polymerase specialized sigma subunit
MPLTQTEQNKLTKLIYDNRDILESNARRFATSNPQNIADFDDYFQEACLILWEVSKQYDPAKGSWPNYLLA